MEHKKLWIWRPVAWICTIIMMIGMQYVAELICRLGEYLVLWLGGLSTIAVVFWAMIFGSAVLSLFFYSATILPSLAVTLSDKIYPSNHAFRYYFVGIYEIIGCATLIFFAIIGMVKGGSLFWFYARYVWLIIASITMMINGRSEAKDRHNQIPSQGAREAQHVD